MSSTNDSNHEIDLYDNIDDDDYKQETNDISNDDLYDDVITGNDDDKSESGKSVSLSSANYSGKRVAMYVGNLTWWTTDKDLMEAAAAVGVTDVLEIKFHENRQNGQSKGFCVMVFSSDLSARTVMDKLPKTEIHNQVPMVTFCNKSNLNFFEQSSGGGSQQQGSGNNNGTSGSGGGGGGGGDRRGGGGHSGGGRDGDKPHNMGSKQQGGMRQNNNGPPSAPPPNMMPRGQMPMNMMPRGFPPGMRPGGPPMPPMPNPGPPPGQMPPGPHPGGMMMPGSMPPQFPGGPPGMMPPGMMFPPGMPNMGGPNPHINPAFMSAPTPGMPPVMQGQQQPMGHPPSSQPGHMPPMTQFDPFGRPIASGFPPGGMNPGAGPPGSSKVSEAEFEEVLQRNKTVSSSAINRAVQDAASGDYASAIETLVTAISLIKQSKIASDDRCKILINSLKDTLQGIESKSYGSKSSGGGSSRRRRRSYSNSGSDSEHHHGEVDPYSRSAKDRSGRSRSRERESRRSGRSREHTREYVSSRSERSRGDANEYYASSSALPSGSSGDRYRDRYNSRH